MRSGISSMTRAWVHFRNVRRTQLGTGVFQYQDLTQPQQDPNMPME